MNKNPLLFIDGYKSSHSKMYPKDTTLVYSNYTCRSLKRMPEKAQEVVVFGIQYMIKSLQELWQENFFNKPKEEVCGQAKDVLTTYLGMDYDVTHFEKLHDLGYLPIKIKALPEGSVTGAGIPLFTIQNTKPEFYWVTNFLETYISTTIWKPVHSASLAYAYKKLLTKYALETDKDNLGFVNFQGHDFSFRGLQSAESGIASGMGFLTAFMGTDTIPAILGIQHYYGDKENIAFSVPASEHSVMCAHGKEGEIDTLKYLMNEYPKGILSVVSDTWDLWKLITEYLPALKEEITSREGKLVIRPDSGDPVDILCGVKAIQEEYDGTGLYYHPADIYEKEGDGDVPSLFKAIYGAEPVSDHERKGVIELLWDIFGGTVNEQGYKVLDSHIGAIYGDSITIERAEQICERLKAKGFASTNVVLGIGSYSMGYATRDNQGGAVKSTYVERNGVGIEIFKDPVTDDGTKKSAKGLLCVREVMSADSLGKFHHNHFELIDQCTKDQEESGALQVVFEDGKLIKTTTLQEIRNKLEKSK